MVSVNECGKNSCQLVCVRCKSKILPPNTGVFEVSSKNVNLNYTSYCQRIDNLIVQDREYELESFSKETAGQKEAVKGFFRVEDMFQVAVSRIG